MTTARKFEELEVWSNSRDLVKRIYLVTAREPTKRDLAFCDQIRRAAISAMSNIAEGFGRYSDREFARYLDIARGSVMETQSLLYVAIDIEYLDSETFSKLTQESSKLVAQLTAFGQYLRKTSAA